jgi:mycofactocin precursor
MEKEMKQVSDERKKENEKQKEEYEIIEEIKIEELAIDGICGVY